MIIKLMLNSTSKLVVTIIAGVIIGWLIRSMNTVDTEAGTAHQTISHEQNLDATNTEQTISVSKKIDQRSTISKTNNTDKRIPDPLPNVDGIVDYLAAMTGKMPSHEARQAIRKLIDETPELGIELLAVLLDIEDEDIKQQLSRTLGTIDSTEEHTLEPWLIARIESGDRPDEWLAFLGKWGLKSRSGFDSVLAQLTNNTDPKVISNSILALNTTLSTYPLAMSPNQREGLSDQLRQFLSASDDDVRRAAVISLSSFPQDDMTQHFLNAFNDSSSKVRHAALMSFLRQPTRSPDIKSLVISQLQDASRSYMERSSLAGLALTLDLSEYEKTLAKDMQREAEENFLSLTEEEQHALALKFDDY